jgi:hypothetical protein
MSERFLTIQPVFVEEEVLGFEKPDPAYGPAAGS